jgi:hypothetical protein
MFPRWTVLVWLLAVLSAAVAVQLPTPWKTFLFVSAYVLPVGWWGVKEALLPDHIGRWQRGSWGERMTASELRPLVREGWAVRHDVQTKYGNHDHLLVGGRVYLLETKYLMDSELVVESRGLRVTRIDQPTEEYLMDALTETMEKRGRKLWRSLRESAGKSIYVHPVVVLWGKFDPGIKHVRGVAYVDGNRLVEWLREQPAELDRSLKERAIQWLRLYER